MYKLPSLQIVRGSDGRFLKGVSGNYRGRPKRPFTIKEIAQTNIEPAVMKLGELLKDSDCPSNVSVFAGAVLMGIAGNQNLMRHFLKKTKQQVWEYLFLPPPAPPGEKTDPKIVNSERVRTILAIRQQLNQELAAKRARRDARLKKQVASMSDDELAYYKAWQ